MGQVPAKYMLPSSPYGSSPAANVLNPTQPAAMNPQTPLLPPNFQSGGQATGQLAGQTQLPGAMAPASGMPGLPGGAQSLFKSLYT